MTSPIPLTVVRARAGNEAARRALYEEHADRVFGFCLAFCRGDRETARDLTQEAFVRAFSALASLQDPAAFPAWLMTTTRRVCLRWVEHKQRERQALEQYADEPLPMRSAIDRTAQVVAEVIAACPDDELRLTATLFYREPPHTTQEIAEQLGISQTAVTTRLYRFRTWAKKRMLAALTRALDEEES